jgi:hypothetical protein
MFFSREHVVWVRARIPLSTRLPLVHACITARSILPFPMHIASIFFLQKVCVNYQLGSSMPGKEWGEEM